MGKGKAYKQVIRGESYSSQFVILLLESFPICHFISHSVILFGVPFPFCLFTFPFCYFILPICHFIMMKLVDIQLFPFYLLLFNIFLIENRLPAVKWGVYPEPGGNYRPVRIEEERSARAKKPGRRLSPRKEPGGVHQNMHLTPIGIRFYAEIVYKIYKTERARTMKLITSKAFRARFSECADLAENEIVYVERPKGRLLQVIVVPEADAKIIQQMLKDSKVRKLKK